MKKETNKIEKFVQALELQGLNEDEQAVVLTGQYGGVAAGYVSWMPCPETTTNTSCTNRSASCNGSSNRNCTNNSGYCGNTTNSGTCFN